MYLLNPIAQEKLVMTYCYLHSTMYLLNPFGLIAIAFDDAEFTFHYVSIKSKYFSQRRRGYFDLHSTMYLLNPHRLILYRRKRIYLHSTMYLLNPVRGHIFIST